LQSHTPSYDQAIGRWVPVEYEYVAPDGASYILHSDASLENPNAFYLVDAKSGNRRLISGDGPPQAPGSWQVIQYASVGVYLWSAGIKSVPGLWLLDPQTGNVRLVDGSHFWSMVGSGAAWALDWPRRVGDQITPWTVYRLDLISGQVSTWLETDTTVTLLSPTQDGDLLISFGKGEGEQTKLLTGPNKLSQLELPPEFPLVTNAYLRHPGLWLTRGPGGLALYVKGEGVKVVAPSPVIFNVAGGCW
jgi:hypothetical protein